MSRAPSGLDQIRKTPRLPAAKAARSLFSAKDKG